MSKSLKGRYSINAFYNSGKMNADRCNSSRGHQYSCNYMCAKYTKKRTAKIERYRWKRLYNET